MLTIFFLLKGEFMKKFMLSVLLSSIFTASFAATCMDGLKSGVNYNSINLTSEQKVYQETKEKIRQKALGRKISEETKKKMSEARIGKCSDKQREHLKKISIQAKAIPVLQFSKTGEFIAKYESVSEAARQTGINGDTIERQLKKPLKNPNDWRVKFIWKKEEIAAIAV